MYNYMDDGSEYDVILESDPLVSVRFHIEDRALGRDLIGEPVLNARVDTHPLRYEIIGSISITRKDGRNESVVLFRPWGHFKQGDVYRIADFSKLQNRLKKVVYAISF